MRCPDMYWVNALIRHAKENAAKHPTLGWVPPRPEGFDGWCLKTRIKYAWWTFTGKVDIVRWYD